MDVTTKTIEKIGGDTKYRGENVAFIRFKHENKIIHVPAIITKQDKRQRELMRSVVGLIVPNAEREVVQLYDEVNEGDMEYNMHFIARKAGFDVSKVLFGCKKTDIAKASPYTSIKDFAPLCTQFLLNGNTHAAPVTTKEVLLKIAKNDKVTLNNIVSLTKLCATEYNLLDKSVEEEQELATKRSHVNDTTKIGIDYVKGIFDVKMPKQADPKQFLGD